MPVTVSGKVPAVCLGPTKKMRNAVPDLLIEAGRKAPTTLDGKPATVRFTRPENPFIAETFTVKIPMAVREAIYNGTHVSSSCIEVEVL